MTRDEILEIESCNEKQLAGINQTLDRIGQFFVYSLILRICIERDDIANLRQVCDVFADNSFSLKEDNNELYKYFKKMEAQLVSSLKDFSNLLLPPKETLETWAKYQAATKFVEAPMLDVQELLKEKFPKLPYPYRGMVLKLNLAATEASRSSKFILEFIRKLVEHDTKALENPTLLSSGNTPPDVNFKELNTEVSQKLPTFIHRLYRETIEDIGKTWPKALLRKVFLNVYGKEEELDLDDLDLEAPKFVSIDAFTQIPKYSPDNVEFFLDPLGRLFVVGILMVEFLKRLPTAKEFQDFCKIYLPEVKNLDPEANELAKYLLSCQEQIRSKLRNSNDFVVPIKKVIGFWTHQRTLMQLFGDGIRMSMDKIEESPLSSEPACKEILSAMKTGLSEIDRVVMLVNTMADAMILHNDEINKIPSRKKAISLDYLESMDTIAEKAIPMHSLFLQQVALDALEDLQEKCPTELAEEIDDDAFLLNAGLVNTPIHD